MDYVSEALHAGQERMDRMESNIAAKTDAIMANVASTEAHRLETREMIEAFNAMKGGMKVLEQIGKAAKIIGGIAFAISAVVGAYHTAMKFFK
jgi:hypothetical protein